MACEGHGGRYDHGLQGAQKEGRESWVRISLAENKLLVAEMFGTVLRIACDRLAAMPNAATIHSMPSLRFLLEGKELSSIADECTEIEPAQVPKRPQEAALREKLALTSLTDVAACLGVNFPGIILPGSCVKVIDPGTASSEEVAEFARGHIALALVRPRANFPVDQPDIYLLLPSLNDSQVFGIVRESAVRAACATISALRKPDSAVAKILNGKMDREMHEIFHLFGRFGASPPSSRSDGKKGSAGEAKDSMFRIAGEAFGTVSGMAVDDMTRDKGRSNWWKPDDATLASLLEPRQSICRELQRGG
jgi:hypothetical protein